MVNTRNLIPDWSRPGSTMATTGTVAQQGTNGNYATVGRRRQRGGRRIQYRREKRKTKIVTLKIGSLNVGTMMGKGRELADMMERRKLDILCIQETKWKGSKARKLGGGCKLYYHGVDGRRSGVGIILNAKLTEKVVTVERVSDWVISMKLEIEGILLNIISAYAPQTGGEEEEKEDFWTDLDEVTNRIKEEESLVIGADLNGHVGEGNKGDEEVIGKYGLAERNESGQMVIDFAKQMKMAVETHTSRKRLNTE